MAKKRVEYRRRKIQNGLKVQNGFSMFLVTLVVLVIMAVVAIKNIELREKLASYNEREEQLQEQYAAEQKRTEEIEEYATYTQTKRFAEEVAKDKLGLVYEGEILFKEE